MEHKSNSETEDPKRGEPSKLNLKTKVQGRGVKALTMSKEEQTKPSYPETLRVIE